MARDGRSEAVSSAAPVDGAKAAGPRSRKGVQTRARLLDAAKEIFEEHGFLDARISDIAERAGMSHGSFYHYFDSKEQIFREVAEVVEERLAEPLFSVMLARSSATPPERLRESLRQYLETYRDDAGIMGVVEQVSRYDEHVSAVLLARHKLQTEHMAESIRELQRRGMADASLDPVIAASALAAMSTRFAEMLFSQGFVECSLEEATDQLARMFVNALGLQDERPARRRRLAAK
jgi:AcrR family transcriptional regulator